MTEPITIREIMTVIDEWERSSRTGRMALHWKDGKVLVLDTKLSRAERAYNQSR